MKNNTPLDRVYSTQEEANKVAKSYFESGYICGWFIYPSTVNGLRVYRIAYYLTTQYCGEEFEFETGD